MATLYRPCVLAVFTNDVGQVLVAERSDDRGQWQFPQGGVDEGESVEAALEREVWEELGTRAFSTLARAREAVRYDFPAGLDTKIARKWRGQLQTWFRLGFAPGAGPDLAAAPDDEFVATRWVTPQQAVDGIVAFKRDAYVQGMRLLGFEVR